MKAMSELTLPDLQAFFARLATAAAPEAPPRTTERRPDR
jgi:hypothetical protein